MIRNSLTRDAQSTASVLLARAWAGKSQLSQFERMILLRSARMNGTCGHKAHFLQFCAARSLPEAVLNLDFLHFARPQFRKSQASSLGCVYPRFRIMDLLEFLKQLINVTHTQTLHQYDRLFRDLILKPVPSSYYPLAASHPTLY